MRRVLSSPFLGCHKQIWLNLHALEVLGGLLFQLVVFLFRLEVTGSSVIRLFCFRFSFPLGSLRGGAGTTAHCVVPHLLIFCSLWPGSSALFCLFLVFLLRII